MAKKLLKSSVFHWTPSTYITCGGYLLLVVVGCLACFALTNATLRSGIRNLMLQTSVPTQEDTTQNQGVVTLVAPTATRWIDTTPHVPGQTSVGVQAASTQVPIDGLSYQLLATATWQQPTLTPIAPDSPGVVTIEGNGGDPRSGNPDILDDLGHTAEGGVQIIRVVLPFIFGTIILIRLIWVETFGKNQMDDFVFIVVFISIVLIDTNSRHDFAWEWFVFLFGGSIAAAKFGKTDYSTVGFYLGGLSIIVFLGNQFFSLMADPTASKWLPVALLLGAIFVTIFEIRREKTTVQTPLILISYLFTQAFIIVFFSAWGLFNVSGIVCLIVHAIYMITFSQIVKIYITWYLAVKNILGIAKKELKEQRIDIPATLATDPALLINYLMIGLFMLGLVQL